MKCKRIISLVFESIILFLGIIGIIVQIGVFDSNINLTIFGYYTIISNIFCIIYILSKLIYKIINDSRKDFIPRFRGSIIMCILVTMLIYHFMLSGKFAMSVEISTLYRYANRILHYIVPSMIFIDWLLFDKKGYYQRIDPFIWLSLPMLYLVYALIVGRFKLIKFFDSYYPYYFIDLEKLGIIKLICNVIGLIVIFLIIGYIIYYFDYLISKREKK